MEDDEPLSIEDDELQKPRRNGFEMPWSWQQCVAVAMILADGVFFTLLAASVAHRCVTVFFYLFWASVCVGGFLLMSKNPAGEPTDEDESLEWCNYCNAPTPPASKHCFDCRKCIPQFDHHCPWLNTCIGGHNYIIFGCTISSVFAMMVFLLIGTADIVLRGGVASFIAACMFLPNLLFGLLDLTLLSLHVYLLITRISTYDLVNWMRELPLSDIGPFLAALYLFLNVDAADGDAADLLHIVVPCAREKEAAAEDEAEHSLVMRETSARYSSRSSNGSIIYGSRLSSRRTSSRRSSLGERERSISDDVRREVGSFIVGSVPGPSTNPEQLDASRSNSDLAADHEEQEARRESADLTSVLSRLESASEMSASETAVLLKNEEPDPQSGTSTDAIEAKSASLSADTHLEQDLAVIPPCEGPLRSNLLATPGARRWLLPVIKLCSDACRCQ